MCVNIYVCILKKEYIYIFWKKYRLGIHTHIYTHIHIYIYTHTFFNLEIHYGCFCYFLEKLYIHTQSLLQPIANGRISICHKNKPHQSTNMIPSFCRYKWCCNITPTHNFSQTSNYIFPSNEVLAVNFSYRRNECSQYMLAKDPLRNMKLFKLCL